MMKQTLVIALMLVVSSSFATTNPSIVNIGLEHSFVPVGFDDNDRIQVTSVGNFADTCYRVADVKTRIDQVKKTIHIFQTAFHYGGICTRVFVPFSSVVNVGIVPAGDYLIYDGTSGKALGRLPVTRATHAGADDYLYAAIHDANITNETPKVKTLTLIGEMPDRCTELTDIRIFYFPDVIVVQPIAKRMGETCAAEKTRFIKNVPIDPKLTGVKLLHVRSLNGQAVNKLVDLDNVNE